ncbi:hypothetical protein KEM56_007451 [Ascosphaera pollenicola]|nr:hypothetical protein KEM56_007451 [Ascosphaera pollenicola]
MPYGDFSVMMTELAKRPRSLSDDSPSFGQMGQRSPKLPKTSHSSVPAATPSSPHPSQAQINYLARRCPESLRLINVDDSLPAIIRLIGEYDSILHRNESIAGNLGICTVGPMLVERFERMFDGPPKVLHSQGSAGTSTSVSWLDVVEFAKTKPDQFKLNKTRNGVSICQIDTKQCRIEISAEDFKLIKNGFGNIVLSQPILEDEEQELRTLGILEKRLSHIIQLADQVSAQAQQLSHSLRSRRSAINTRRQHDINMQAQIQLQQADPAGAGAGAGRLTKQGSWLGQGQISGASSYPLTPGVEPPSARSNDASVFPGMNRQPLPEQRVGSANAGGVSAGETAPPSDARKADQHLDNILSATTFFPAGTVPENVTIINGANIRSASPSTRSEMMRRFLSPTQLAATAAAAADRPDGLANRRDHLNRSTEEESKSYRPLMTSAAPRDGDELRVLPGHPGRQPAPHQLPHHPHGQPRGTEPDVSKPITEYASIQSFAPPTTGPPVQKSHAVVPIANAPTFHSQHTGPSHTSRTSASRSPPRAGQHSSKSHGQSQPRDDGGPFKIQMISRMEGLRRGERILPPCDRCRRLGMECLKNLTACVGCTKKHAKCSWKDVKLEELQDTRPREVLSMIAGRTDLPPITFHQDRRSAQPSSRSQKSEKKKRESPGAKAPSQSGGKSPQSAPTVTQPASGDADGNLQSSLTLRSTPLPSQQPQEASTASMPAPTVPRASSIPAATHAAHGSIAPEAMMHTRPRELSLPSPSSSSSARPHSMSANTAYSTLAGYHAHAGSPSSAPSTLPVYTAPPTTSNNPQSNQSLSPGPPASSQQQQQQQRPQFPPLQRYQSELQRPSLSQYPMRSPDQNNRNEHSIANAARRNSTREYDSSRTHENVRRLEKDPLSLAISDTIAQHMAARAAAEANASASGRRDSVSAASASAASAASASPGRTAMTPLSAGAGPGPTPNKSSLLTIDEGGSKGAAAAAASSLGPMLSPSSGPAEAKRAPSPLDVTANDSARYEWAREQTKENERERQWGEAGHADYRNARNESDGDVEMGNAS